VETRGPEHTADVLAGLSADGYVPRRIQRAE
jgi:hypothetical protein